MTPLDYVVVTLLGLAVLFFFAGTIGLLRFPDVYSRLHALTKADNLGLGLAVVALMIHSMSAAVSLRLFLTWALVLISSATTSHLIARAARDSGVEPWSRQ